MKISTLIRYTCSAVIGGTLAYRGVYWYQPSFWVICIAAGIAAVAAEEAGK